VAKVMISIPDELLAALDARAKEEGSTRSAYLQRLASADIDATESLDRDRLERLLGPTLHGGEPAAAAVRRLRDSR